LNELTHMPREHEAKFYVASLQEVRKRLEQNGAHLSEARHRESNLRFDTPDGRMAASHELLRLRQDSLTRLTFKRQLGRPEIRQEIEIIVDNRDKAQAFLEALGFQISGAYEKNREIYGLGHARIMLDDMPFGCFVEIEGPSIDSLVATASKLGLAWQKRVTATYLALFEELRQKKRLPFAGATFSNFSSLPAISAEDLGVADALIPLQDE
jgi:adenylate cyclase class 2